MKSILPSLSRARSSSTGGKKDVNGHKHANDLIPDAKAGGPALFSALPVLKKQKTTEEEGEQAALYAVTTHQEVPPRVLESVRVVGCG